jgi:SAM-dependent methyltransferase
MHRWRRRLFGVWQADTHKGVDDSALGQAVDDIVGVALLTEYLRRSGCEHLPTLADVCKGQSHPTIGSVVAAVASQTHNDFLASILQPNDFAALPVPASIFDERWERRLANAVWLVFRERELPFSLFGDFHQLCMGSPLTVTAAGLSTRRARGMFYTPAPIVDYMVSATLSRLLADRTPEELVGLRVLDPSCGCGAFLIGCFRFLIRWHERRLGDLGMARQHAFDLMSRAFSGCDIDPRALQWTARLLALAAWHSARGDVECSGDAELQAIPNFKPVLECRSFLEPHGDDNQLVPEPQYDAIIGGPPFVRLEALHRSQKERLRYYRQRFLSAQRGKFDLYMLFIEQALDLLKPGGLLAFSLSNSFLRSEGGRRIRGYIAANASVEEVLEFDDSRTYADAATQIALLRLRKTRATCGGRHALVGGRGRLRHKLECLASDRPHPDIAITPLKDDATDSSRWRVTDRNEERWLESILKAGIPLGRLVTVEHGPSTGMDAILLLRKVRSSCSEILARRREEQKRTRFEAAAMRSVIRGHQLKRYGQVSLPNLYPFPYDDRSGKPLSEADLRVIYPLTYRYLLLHREALSHRHLANGCPWYSTFVRLPSRSSKCGRLMSSTITSGKSFILVHDPKLLAHNSVVVLAPRDDDVDLYFLLAVLNSKVFSRYIALTMPRISAGRFSLRLSAMRRFPVPGGLACPSDGTGRQIASLARKLLGVPAGRVGSDLRDTIEAEVARLYVSVQ